MNPVITKINHEKEWLKQTSKISKDPPQDVKDKKLKPRPSGVKKNYRTNHYNQSEGNRFITNDDL